MDNRGVDAIRFGLAVDKDGFNVYVAGPAGTGRTTSTQALIAELAASRAAPSDWCYLHNFQDPTQPVAVDLGSGEAPRLAHDLEELIAGARREVPRVFEGEEYQRRRAEIAQQLQTQREALLDRVRAKAERLGFAIEFPSSGTSTFLKIPRASTRPVFGPVDAGRCR